MPKKVEPTPLRSQKNEDLAVARVGIEAKLHKFKIS